MHKFSLIPGNISETSASKSDLFRHPMQLNFYCWLAVPSENIPEPVCDYTHQLLPLAYY
jgi:hypothetical protein